MTPAATGDISVGISGLHLGVLAGLYVIAEDLLDLVAALLQAAQRQAERGDAVADRVIGPLACDGEEQGPLVGLGAQAAPGELLREGGGALFDLDEERLARPGEAVHRVGPQQVARFDRDKP